MVMFPKIVWQFCMLLLCFISTKGGEIKEVSGNEVVNPDDPLKCVNRPKHFQFGGHNYFFTLDVPEFKSNRYDWLAARGVCRERCMDAVSIETEAENNMIFNLVTNHDVYDHAGPTWRNDGRCGPRFPFQDGTTSSCDPLSQYSCCAEDGYCWPNDDCHCHECIDYSHKVDYIWTAGRLCDFTGCEDRDDLLPLNINGWFWANSQQAIPPTNRASWSYNPWSQTGHHQKPQPDNAEADINGAQESCMSVLNNVYDDGIKWHDIACYHKKPVVCEDDDSLLNYMKAQYPEYADRL